MNSNLCVFILSHGRPDNVKTYRTLRDSGYKGPIFIIVDNMDNTVEKYVENYGEKVIVFDKLKAAEQTDSGNNFNKMNSVLFARNICHETAKKLGYKYFLELDDDYTGFRFRIDDNLDFGNKKITNIEPIIDDMIDFLEFSGAKSIAFAQGGDLIGGSGNYMIKDGPKLKRKVMNTFFCRTEDEWKFVGILNDDVNTYITLGHRGHLFFTIPQVTVDQMDTQSQSGGLTDLYLDQGTYVKSFYSIMYCPSFVKITVMGNKDMRLHHKIKWKNAVPKILSAEYRK